jgi:hypothetical protein
MCVGAFSFFNRIDPVGTLGPITALGMAARNDPLLTGVPPTSSEPTSKWLASYEENPYPELTGVYSPIFVPDGTPTHGLPEYVYEQCAVMACHGNVVPPYTRGYQTEEEARASALMTAAEIGTVGVGKAVRVVRGAAAAVAEATAPLPEALTVGKNAERGVDVYMGIRNGEKVYVGISNNVVRRADQHIKRYSTLQVITKRGPLTRGEARAIEQYFKTLNPNFDNIRNSISPRHEWYQQAMDWAAQWVKNNGK